VVGQRLANEFSHIPFVAIEDGSKWRGDRSGAYSGKRGPTLSDAISNAIVQRMTLTLRARVRGGRLVLDEPVDLPEGSEVELMPVDQADDLDDADRARLHAALQRAEGQLQAGETLTREEFAQCVRRT
jgi:hypothetical protein